MITLSAISTLSVKPQRQSVYESIFHNCNWSAERKFTSDYMKSYFGSPPLLIFQPRLLMHKIIKFMASPIESLKYLLNIKVQALPQNLGEFARHLRDQIDQQLPVQSFVKLNLPQLPKTLSLENIQKQASAVMKNTNRYYQPSYAFARAWQINDKLARLFSTNHCFTLTVKPIGAGLRPAATSFFQGVRWHYHSVAAVYGEDGQVYVFDPVIDHHKALTVADWLKHFKHPEKLDILLTPKNSTARFESIPADTMRTEDTQDLVNVQNCMNEHITSDVLQTEEPILPLANFAYHCRHDRQGPVSYSFSKPIAEKMAEFNFYLDLKLLYTIEFKQNEEPDAYPLFCQEKEGQLYGMTKLTFENELIRRGIKRIEVTDIPCNLNDPRTFRVLERDKSRIPEPRTLPAWGQEVMTAFNMALLNIQ